MATKRVMNAAIYARVSTQDQNCGLQLTELRAYAERMAWTIVEYVEKASGKAGGKRPVLDRLLADARLRNFDVVLVWKLDRFGRSLIHLIGNIQTLSDCGVRFVSPNQGIDTDQRSPAGKLMLSMLGAFAEFERDLIIERTRAGVEQYREDYTAGRAKSRSGKNLPIGRPARIFRRDEALVLSERGFSLRSIARQLNVSFMTVQRHLKASNSQ